MPNFLAFSSLFSKIKSSSKFSWIVAFIELTLSSSFKGLYKLIYKPLYGGREKHQKYIDILKGLNQVDFQKDSPK